MKSQWFIKRWFLQGLVLMLPAIITAVVLYYGVIYADIVLWFLLDLLPWSFPKPTFVIPGLGLIVVAGITIIIGALTESFLVSKAVNLFNTLMSKVPIIRSIYSTVLKVAQNTLGNFDSFSQVVLLEHNGKYCMAFQTSETSPEICNKVGSKLINVFLPTTPNPTSGFYIMVPEDKITPLDIEPETAFKLIISAGIVKD
jgi:uncharacterized membrane protein